MDIVIRTASSDDVDSIQKIYATHVLNGLGTFEEAPPTIAEMSSRMESIKADGYPYLVATVDNKVVGFCYANYYRQRSAYRYTVEDSVYVDSSYQGIGIAKFLLAELIKECRELNFKQMLAIIGDSDNQGSIKLHKSLGFVHAGTMTNVGYKFDCWVDVVIMQLNLMV